MIALALLLLLMAAPPATAPPAPSGAGWGSAADDPPAQPAAPPADVQAAAEAAVAAVWPDAEVEVVRLSAGAETAAPPLRVRLADDRPLGRVSAEVEARGADGAWERAGWAYLDVAVYAPAAVLTRDLKRGDALDGALRTERVEVGAADPLRAADLAGWTAARSLRAGTVLTARHVRAPAAAERGDPLRVRYRRGVVSITLACTSRERGAVGESVRAVCDRSTYRVLLTAPGQGDWTATL